MADQEYTVKVTTSGDPSAVDALGKSLEKATAATKEHGDKAEHTSGVLEQLGHRSGGAREAIEGFERATQGGTSGVLGLAKGMLALRESLAINPLTFFAGAALGLIPTVIELAHKLFETGEEGKKAGEGLSEAAEAGKRLGDVKLDDFKTELDGIIQRKAALDEFGAKLDEIAKKTADAKKAAEIAEVDASDLDPEAKKKEKYAIEERYAKGDAAREDAMRRDRLESARLAAEETAAVAAKAVAERDRKAGFIQTDYDSQASIQERIAQLRNEQSALLEDTRMTPTGESQTTRRNANRAGVRRRAAEISELEESANGGLTNEMQAYQAGVLEKLTEAAKKAEEAAKKAADEFQRLSTVTSLEETNAPTIRGLEAKTRRLGAGVPDPTSRGGTSSDVIGGGISFGGRPWYSGSHDSALPAANPEGSIIINGQRVDAAFKKLSDTIVGAIEKSAADAENKIKAARR